MTTAAYDGTTGYAANRTVSYAGRLWEPALAVPRQLPPAGVGDGSTADRDLLLSHVAGFAKFAGCTGGYSGATYTVITTADSGAGSYRAALESATAYWIVFDKAMFPPGVGGTITLTSTCTPLPNKTVDGRGATVRINSNAQHLVQGIGNPTTSGTSFIRFPAGVANMIFSNVTYNTTATNLNRDCFTISYGTDKIFFNQCAFTGGTDGAIDISQPDDGGIAALYGTPNTIKTRVHFSWCRFGPMPTNANLAQQGPITGGNNLPENGKTNLWGLQTDTPDKLFVSADHCLWDGCVQRNPKMWYGANGHLWNCVVRRWSLIPGVVPNSTVKAQYTALGKTSVTATYGSIGTQFETSARGLVESCLFEPYNAGDPHVLDATWPVLVPDLDALGTDGTALLRTSDLMLLGGATRSPDNNTGGVPVPSYAYTKTAVDTLLRDELVAYAGNYQPWQLA